MKKNVYEIEKNIEKLLKGNSTGFLTLNVINEIKGKLKKYDYQIFSPYTDSEKIILYSKKEPNIKLYRIDCYEQDKISHSSILGSLFGLNITSEMFGDIILYDGDFYVYILDDISEYIVNNFAMVGNISIKLIEVNLDFLSNYKRQYEELELIVSSLRIDAVVSRLCGFNREKTQDSIKNEFVLLNGRILNKSSYILKDGDIFSIKRYGKYKYIGILKTTKKDNYLIKIDKYV